LLPRKLRESCELLVTLRTPQRYIGSAAARVLNPGRINIYDQELRMGRSFDQDITVRSDNGRFSTECRLSFLAHAITHGYVDSILHGGGAELTLEQIARLFNGVSRWNNHQLSPP